MDIETLNFYRFNKDKNLYNLFPPKLAYLVDDVLFEYTVQKGETMRFDLVALSMYDNNESVLKNIDILMLINDIDNPLNVVEGMVFIYPPDIAKLDSYRIELKDSLESGKDIKDQIAIPNKTTRVDQNRKRFVENGYSLPPTVLSKSKSPVRVEGDKIVIGGLN